MEQAPTYTTHRHTRTHPNAHITGAHTHTRTHARTHAHTTRTQRRCQTSVRVHWCCPPSPTMWAALHLPWLLVRVPDVKNKGLVHALEIWWGDSSGCRSRGKTNMTLPCNTNIPDATQHAAVAEVPSVLREKTRAQSGTLKGTKNGALYIWWWWHRFPFEVEVPVVGGSEDHAETGGWPLVLIQAPPEPGPAQADVTTLILHPAEHTIPETETSHPDPTFTMADPVLNWGHGLPWFCTYMRRPWEGESVEAGPNFPNHWNRPDPGPVWLRWGPGLSLCHIPCANSREDVLLRPWPQPIPMQCARLTCVTNDTCQWGTGLLTHSLLICVLWACWQTHAALTPVSGACSWGMPDWMDPCLRGSIPVCYWSSISVLGGFSNTVEKANDITHERLLSEEDSPLKITLMFHSSFLDQFGCPENDWNLFLNPFWVSDGPIQSMLLEANGSFLCCFWAPFAPEQLLHCPKSHSTHPTLETIMWSRLFLCLTLFRACTPGDCIDTQHLFVSMCDSQTVLFSQVLSSFWSSLQSIIWILLLQFKLFAAETRHVVVFTVFSHWELTWRPWWKQFITLSSEYCLCAFNFSLILRISLWWNFCPNFYNALMLCFECFKHPLSFYVDELLDFCQDLFSSIWHKRSWQI